MTIGEFDGSPFALEYIRRQREILKLSRSQRIPGLKDDDVRSELQSTLWHAFQTFNPRAGTTLGQWWWVLWIRRKSDLIEAFFAQKNPRPHEVLSGLELVELAESFAPMVDLEDLCPSDDSVERAMWRMLADGFTGVEVRRKLRLSVRRFYDIVANWQTDDLRCLLVD